MKLLVHAVAAASVLLAAVPAIAVEEAAVQKADSSLPIELVRTLQMLQDQIAHGSTAAHGAQRGLLSHIDQRLMTLDDKAWQDRRNIHASIVFVLSGGKPDILKKILGLKGVAEQESAIMRGALAYVEGREIEAQQFLDGINVRSLPPTLAGQLALVQSALMVREKPEKSVELLDFARLQLPGTLVEEAALRREIFVVSQLGDAEKFDTLSRQYLRRFRQSIYSGNFRQRFSNALLHLEYTKDHTQFPRLVALLDELEPEGQRELYLLVARAAIDQGKTQVAILAANKAHELSGSDKISAERSKLYRAAAAIVTAQGFDAGITELKGIDRESLPDRDVNLLEAALSMAAQIRSIPAPVPEDALVSKHAYTMDKMDEPRETLPSISRARKALEKVDQLFRREIR